MAQLFKSDFAMNVISNIDENQTRGHTLRSSFPTIFERGARMLSEEPAPFAQTICPALSE
jgi:hypothetical protein